MSSPATASPLPAPRHYPALDGLRGLAILLVIPHNSDVFAPGTLLLPAWIAHTGWIGVQLFFVLSGFLITSNLLDSQSASNYYSSFFARRTLRIFPLYYGTLFVVLIVLPHFIAHPPQIMATHVHQVWLWTFLVNWVEPFGKTVHGFSHFWSLAVEEQFYLVWPLLMHRRTARAAALLCGALIVVALLVRCGMLLHGARPEEIYMFTVCRMDALAAGAAAAALLRVPAAAAFIRRAGDRLLIAALVLGIAGALVTSAYAVYGTGTFTIGYTVLSICFALLLLAGLDPAGGLTGRYQALLKFAPLRSVGKYSYGMYVFHLLIILSLGQHLLPVLKQFTAYYPLLYPAIMVALSYAIAVLSYQCFERHFLKLKDGFKPRPAPTLPTLP